MGSFPAFSVVVFTVLTFASSAILDFHQELKARDWTVEWQEFKVKFGKTYSNTWEEEKRYKIFRQNMVYITTHNHEQNRGLHHFTMTVNEFADMEREELTRQRNGFRPNSKNLRSNYTHNLGATFLVPNYVQLPDTVDWRKEGYVTPVKNQGACGSCWSFSATGALEGQIYRKTGRLVSISEQNLVDCSTKWGNNGCNGGLMDQAFQYIKDNAGIDSEADYPYEAQDDVCRYDPSEKVATDKGFSDIDQGDEEKLQMACATVGPISVAIDASHKSFQLYHRGVYEDPDCSPMNLDHGVLVVGYGTENGKDYWLVKNSWGESWGDQGYIKIRRNHNNMCGVASQASFPLV